MKIKSTFTLIVVAFMSVTSLATNHIVTFGAYYYSPSNITVAVGDTITWQGNFSFHPLSTTSVPTGAETIEHISTGTSYSYPVLIDGIYNYRCDTHYAEGMTGSFIAASITDVAEVLKPDLTFRITNWAGMVRINNDSELKTGNYSIRISNILGEMVSSDVIKSGEQEKIIDTENSPGGIYVITITDDNHRSFVKKFMMSYD